MISRIKCSCIATNKWHNHVTGLCILCITHVCTMCMCTECSLCEHECTATDAKVNIISTEHAFHFSIYRKYRACVFVLIASFGFLYCRKSIVSWNFNDAHQSAMNGFIYEGNWSNRRNEKTSSLPPSSLARDWEKWIIWNGNVLNVLNARVVSCVYFLFFADFNIYKSYIHGFIISWQSFNISTNTLQMMSSIHNRTAQLLLLGK